MNYTYVIEIQIDDLEQIDNLNSYNKNLLQVIDCLNLGQVVHNESHLSIKYGLSSWIITEGGKAIHAYAWSKKTPGLLTLDIISKTTIHMGILQDSEHQRNIPITSSNVGIKLLTRDDVYHIKQNNIMTHITRERRKLIFPKKRRLGIGQIEIILNSISNVLGMSIVNSIKQFDDYFWVHWEASGIVLSYFDGLYTVDIYACKTIEDTILRKEIKRQFGIESFICNKY